MYSARYYFIFLKTWAFCCCCFALHRFSSCPVCAWSTLFHQYFESPWALMRCIWWMKLLNYYPLYLRSHGGPVKLPLTKNGRGKKWSSFIKKKKEDSGNCRLVSLISVPSKITEKILMETVPSLVGPWATWCSGRCPWLSRREWNWTVFKIPSNPDRSMFLWFYDFL